MKNKLIHTPIDQMRRNYTQNGLLEKDVNKNPIEQFRNWFTEATISKIIEPNAMTLATPKAGIGQTVYEAASDIEQSGCAQIVTDNQANWQKQDALMSEVKAAAKK